MKTALIWLIFTTFNQVHVLDALVPKQVLKRGLMAFVQEISHKPITDQNLCFVVFESWVEALLDRQSTLEEAFGTTFSIDLTTKLSTETNNKTIILLVSPFIENCTYLLYPLFSISLNRQL